METEKAKLIIRKVVKESLRFFVETDLKMYGFIQNETLEIFKVQKAIFPKELNKFTEEFIKLKAELYNSCIIKENGELNGEPEQGSIFFNKVKRYKELNNK